MKFRVKLKTKGKKSNKLNLKITGWSVQRRMHKWAHRLYTHARTHSLSRTHACKHTFSLSLSHTHTLFHARTLSLIHTRSYTHACATTLSVSYTHTLSLSHTRNIPLQHMGEARVKACVVALKCLEDFGQTSFLLTLQFLSFPSFIYSSIYF